MLSKNHFDLVVAIGGFVFLMPLLILVALLVLWNDGRPVIFRQTRVGQNGCEFTLYTFRTMAACPLTEKGSFGPGDTSRVTPTGYLLRKTKLDELPQVWNVLKGDMSLVGPRCEGGWKHTRSVGLESLPFVRESPIQLRLSIVTRKSCWLTPPTLKHIIASISSLTSWTSMRAIRERAPLAVT